MTTLRIGNQWLLAGVGLCLCVAAAGCAAVRDAGGRAAQGRPVLTIAASSAGSNAADATAIVVPAEALPSERYAAGELQRYLEAMCGARLPIVTDQERPRPQEIVLGATNRRLAALGLRPDAERLGQEGFWLKTASGCVAVAGGRPRGTLYGVYALLEEQLGVRWWTPDAETVPRRARVTLPKLDEMHAPAFEYREVYWMEMMGTNAEFAARHRLNGAQSDFTEKHGGRDVVYYPFCHSLDALIPRELFEKHPDYFPLVNGQRLSGYTQRCLSNPEVVKLAIANVRAWIREHPEATIISVTQNDTEGYCTCPDCRGLDEAEGSPAASFLRFVNAIAEDVEKDYPAVRIDTFAYQYTRRAPKTLRPRANVIVRLCSIECCFAHPLDGCVSGENRSFVADMQAWERVAPKLYVWDYTTNFRHYQQPFPNWDALQANVRFFRQHGVKGLFEQGNYSGGGQGEMEPLRAYVLAKLLWNPEADVERHIREFVDGYYGRAAPKIRAYLAALRAQVREPGSHAHIFDKCPTFAWRVADALVGVVGVSGGTAVYLKPEFLRQADGLLAEAERLAENDAIRRRVQVARVPIWYVLLASGQLEGAERAAVLRRFVETVRQAGIARLSESGRLGDELRGLGWAGD